MARVAPDRWPHVSPYLDRVLDIVDDRARRTWLDALREEDGVLAAEVEALLRQHHAVQAEGFLEPSGSPEWLEMAPERVGAYTLLTLLGRGGMGTVWLAQRSDGQFERRVAIKLLNRSLGSGEARFRREGQILARLAHPHIAQLLDAGVSGRGNPYLVLELVDGEPIDRYCDEHRLDVRARLRLFLDVLDAVGRAHAALIVHRDIKPSNVLVTTDGAVKLLDFGIAKLLEDGEPGAAALTAEGAAALTLAYAAPEQVTGQPVSTATDVYALGVLLYVLLTGRHPAGGQLHSPAGLVKAIVDMEPPRPSDVVIEKARRLLRGDLDTIVGVALKKEPEARFRSVVEFADDVRRYLRHEPIKVRPESFAYRAAKFVRRNRVPVAAAVAVVAALSAGLYTTNRQRVLAERRFTLVRGLASKLFDIDVAVRSLSGNVAARQLIVDTSLDYLGQLVGDAKADPVLALELGTAYMRVARVQGVPISPNLGQLEQAERTLQVAEPLIDSVIAALPQHRIARLRRAQVAHDRMILAGLRRPDDMALPLARESARWLDQYLTSGDVDRAEALQLALALSNVANRFRIEAQFGDALRLTRRGLDVANAAPGLENQIGGLWIGMSRIHRDVGALDEALRAATNAVQVLEGPAKTSANPQTFGLALVTQAEILGSGGVGLGRAADAILPLQRAFAIADEAAHRDPRDAQSRGLVSTAGRELAELLRKFDDREALAVYDHVLHHLGEIANNARFRRDEARALSASTYPLRRLGRGAEARRRLDVASARLRVLKMDAAKGVELGSEVHDVLLALADHQAATGDLRGAVETGERLLRGIEAAQPEAESRLGEAAEMSELFVSLASIQRRGAQAEAAAALDARRLRLWQHWDRRLARNPFVATQLTEVRGHLVGP
jgi:tetratricopeptide (TPR) repeat protein